MKKTRWDLMYAMIDNMAADAAGRKALRERFEMEVVPLLKDDPQWNELISDEEFDQEMEAMREGLPGFVAQLHARRSPRSRRKDSQES